MKTLPEIIEEYRVLRGGCTYRELAMLERSTWDEVRALPEMTGIGMEKWFVDTFHDLSNRDVRLRAALLADDEHVGVLWDRIQRKELAPAAALGLLYEARALAKGAGVELSIALDHSISKYDKLPFVSRSKDGYLFRKKSPKKVKRKNSKVQEPTPRSFDKFYEDIKTRTDRFLTSMLPHTDPIFVTRLRQELLVMLRVVGVDFRRLMANALTMDAHSAKLSADRITREQLEEACAALKMDPPEFGSLVDLTVAKRQKWRLANEYHPDKTHRDTSELFNSVLTSFDVVEKYNAQHTGETSAKSSA